MDFEIYDIRMENQNDFTKKIKEDIKSYLPRKIEYCLSEVNKKLLEVENDPEKLKLD